MPHTLIPRPQHLAIQEGQWTPGPTTVIAFDRDALPLRPALQRFCAQATELTGQPFRLLERPDPAAHAGANVSFVFGDRSRAPQSYGLVVNATGACILARDAAGAFYGLQTLLQLLREYPRAVPALEIEDAPALAERGYMLDISRCKVPTLATLRALIDRLAGLKYNQLQLYTEHTFAFRDHAVAWADASPLTAAEVRELDAYCAERFIELVPNFNSFGHFERWLRHPQYKHLAESPEGFIYAWGSRGTHGTTLHPGPESLAFLDGLYGELLPNFRSPKFNIGCDEPWELGQGRSRARCEREGKHRVYLEHLRALLALAVQHGRQPQFWADILMEEPALAAELPPGSTGLVWGYEADHPFAEQAAHFGQHQIPFYVCPGTSAWNSLGGRWRNGRANLESAVEAALHGRARGLLLTDWGDGGHHQVPAISLLGLAYAAALAWQPEANRGLDLEACIDTQVQPELPGLTAVLLALAHVSDPIQKQRPNNSPLNDWLFAPLDQMPGLLQGIGIAELDAVAERLAAISGQIEQLQARSAEADLLLAELRWTHDALALAQGRASDHLRRLHNPNAILRRSQYRSLIGRHEALWIARHRIGGLHESSARLRAMIAG